MLLQLLFLVISRCLWCSSEIFLVVAPATKMTVFLARNLATEKGLEQEEWSSHGQLHVSYVFCLFRSFEVAFQGLFVFVCVF